MKNTTLKHVRKLLTGIAGEAINRRPNPFPGRRYPTRVVWSFRIAQTADRTINMRAVAERAVAQGRRIAVVMGDPDFQQPTNETRSLTYIGKPNRYRALEAQRFLQLQPGEVVVEALECEFDKGGVLWASSGWRNHAYTVYHPHSGVLGPISSFARQVYPKRVGGLTLYSFKDKLSQEELDMFYAWYESVFKHKLKRPRGKAGAMKELESEDA